MKVLILDDEAELLELCVDAFEMYDHETVGFTSAGEALKNLLANSFDVIVSDSHMPEMYGEEFFKSAKELLGESMPPFFLATGSIEVTEDSVQALGMTGLITKPFDIGDLVGRVEQSLKN